MQRPPTALLATLQVASWRPGIYGANPAAAALHALFKQLGRQAEAGVAGGALPLQGLDTAALQQALPSRDLRQGGCGWVWRQVMASRRSHDC